MGEDRSLIEKIKKIIMSDCIDAILVSNGEISRYLKKKKNGFLPMLNKFDTRLEIHEAVAIAANELAAEGKVFKSGKRIRAILKH